MVVLLVIQYFKVICRLSCLSDNNDYQLPTQESNPEPKFQCILNMISGAWGSVVVKALYYFSDGLGIDSRGC